MVQKNFKDVAMLHNRTKNTEMYMDQYKGLIMMENHINYIHMVYSWRNLINLVDGSLFNDMKIPDKDQSIEIRMIGGSPLATWWSSISICITSWAWSGAISITS